MAAWIGWPLGCFATAVVAHGIAVRLPFELDSVRRFLLVGVPIGAVLLFADSLGPWSSASRLAAILGYAFLCELYVFLFTLVISSISATTLILLRTSELEERDILLAHSPEEMVRTRVDGLVAIGLILRDGERLVVTPKGLRLHQVFSRLRTLFCHASTAEV